jgi:hypothetical protein
MGMLFFLLMIVFGVYEFGGGRYYWEMIDIVHKETGNERQKIEDEVWGTENSKIYGGILITANEKGVWLWGRSGPRFFAKKDGPSVYYFYNTCSQENLKRASELKATTTIKDAYPNIGEWNKKLRQGDYVAVQWESSNSHQLSKLYGYASWYFSHKSLSEQCKKRF